MYFVPSGAFASFPSASLYVGASVVTASPAFPSLSAYVGVRLSAVFSAILITAFDITFIPFGYVKVTGTVTVWPLRSLVSSALIVTSPVCGSTVTGTSLSPTFTVLRGS